MLSTTVTTNGSTATTTLLWSELFQLIIALALVAVYIVEIVTGKGDPSFIAGSLVSVVAFYFGGKANTAGAIAATNAINAAPTTTTTTSPTA